MKFSSSLLLLLWIPFASAQQPTGNTFSSLSIGRLYGKIIDVQSKEPIAYASVVVLKTLKNGQDSLIGGSLCLENGDFNITNLPMGALKLKVSFVGNKDLNLPVKISQPNNIEQDLGDLGMTQMSQVLGTVEITAEKASTMISLEKRVFNVDKSLTAAGGTAEDVLKNVPSITVDVDGNAKLRDRGTTIYVDGKPTLMSLTQIPSDQIESVEVISNPSAKYEASSSGGILNIVLKKNRKPGYNGVIGLGLGSQNRYNGMLNLNAHEGKWSIGGFYNVNATNAPSTGYVYRTNLNTEGVVQNYFNQNTDVTFQNAFQIGRLILDYSINNRNTISLSGTKVNGKFNIMSNQNYEYMTSGNQLTSYGTRITTPENDFKNNSVEAQWKKTFATKNKSLSALATYGWGSVSNLANWTTTGFDRQGNTLSNYPELVQINGANSNSQAIFQLDYVNPINESSKIELGLRSYWSGRDQNYFYKPFSYSENEYVQDNQFSQDTRITESINAAYITYSGHLENKINYQAGLRFEQSNLTGISHLDGASDFGYSYPNGNGTDLLRSLFPAIYISKKVDASTELGLNFSRKIQRPRFQQLMPGIQSNDKQNIQIGNPNLQPEFINLAELNYNKIFGSHNWLSTLYLSNETNTIKPFISPSITDPSVLVTRFVNGTSELMYGLDNTLKLGFGKNLEIMLNANLFKFNVSVDTITNSGWTGNGKINLTYRLPSNFSVQLNGALEGNRPIPQGNRQSIAYADFAVKKSFFHNAANVTFSVNDIFNTRKDITVFTQPTFIQETMRRRDTRYFKLSLQIPFGKADASIFKKSSKRQEGQEQPDFSGN
ncbi:MAG: outer membrane beta-barrel protein [Saprospiraceae bacterium]